MSAEPPDDDAAKTSAAPTGSADEAIIGNSIRIQGEVTGDEDLTIQGYVDGSVKLDQHAVTVGPDGEVHADIVARVITVDGQVDGDLTADEQIVVRSSARVEGDISAPRVVLEDGAHFRGGVDMDRTSGSGGRDGSGPGSRSSRSRSATGLSSSSSGEEASDEDREDGGDSADDS